MANVVEIVITGKNLASPVIKGATGEASMLGSTWAKVGAVSGAALIGIGVEAGKMAMNFDAAMTRLTSQAGVAQDQMGYLKSGVLSLAGKVGEDPDSLAESLFHVESNFESVGITSKDALGLVETAAKGAKVGNADLVDVTNALTASVASGIPGVKNFDQAMGALNATVGVGDMTMQDLASAFSTGMVAVVKNYGLSIQDVGASLAVFGDNNIRGAGAATQLRMAVQSMAVPAKGGKDALDKLGLSSDTLAKDMQTGGLNKAITDLHNKLIAMNPDTKTWGDTLTQAFGKKAGTGLLVLLNNFDKLQSKYPALNEGANNFGKSWEITSGTTKQKMDQMQEAFKALMITIGEKLLPVVVSVFNFFASHTEVLKLLGIVVGVFLVGAFTAWAVSVIAATWPIILIIAAVAAVVVGIYELWKHWDIVWGGMKQYAEDFGHWMWDFFVQWLFHDGLQVGFDATAGAIMTAWHAVSDAFTTTINALVLAFWAFVHAMETAWFATTGAIQTAWRDTTGFITRIFNDVVGWFRTAISTINGFFGGLFSFITGGIKGAVDYVNRIIGDMVDGISRAVGKAKGLVNSIPGVGTIAKAFGFAHGGITGAATGGPRGALTEVGEHGGELIDLPSGSRVYSHSDTDRIMNSGGGGGVTRVVLEIKSDGTRFSSLLVEIIREAVRDRGGNVQKVLSGAR
jgi:TP901 family phage tail tape measure protein